MKKIIGIVLVLVLVIIIGGLHENIKYVKAEIDYTSYIPISNADELANISNDVAGKYYLTNDIDLASYGLWKPIVDFKGTLNGNNYCIKNVSITNGGGLFFSLLSGAVIENLGLDNINIKDNTSEFVGGITGSIYNYTGSVIINNCYVTGKISSYTYQKGGSSSGYYSKVGGICGSIFVNEGSVQIKNCYNGASISGYNVGGIIGGDGDIKSIEIENCVNTGTVSGLSNAGGIVGTSRSKVSYCYNSGKVLGDSTVGGVAARASNNAYFYKCYYLSDSIKNINKNVLGISYNESLTNVSALNYGNMRNNISFSEWDFLNVWVIEKGINNSYPILQSMKDVYLISNPIVSKKTGSYSEKFKVTLNSELKGATIYFSTDGTTPTTKSKKYTKAILISKTTSLKVLVVKIGYRDSNITTFKYKLK